MGRQLQQLFLASVDGASARPLWNVPLDPSRRMTLRWAPNGHDVLIGPTYLPLDATDEAGRGGNAVAVIDVRTGTYTTLPISPEDAKQIRGASWNGAGDVEIELPNQRLEFRKRARDWVFLGADSTPHAQAARSEEHTSELQSPMRLPYAVLCLKKKTK